MRLHRRAALATLRALALAAAIVSCSGGGETELRASCPSPETQEIACVSPGEVIQGSKLPATWDRNNCQVRQEVTNSCCRAAQAGPVLKDGKCCYAFCSGPCC
jgi:hypothetical protein